MTEQASQATSSELGVKEGRRADSRSGGGWQAEKSALTRQAILDAAIRCFVDRGYRATTTAMISAEAGVSRGAMMHHFPSRMAVMAAVVAHLHKRRLSEYRSLMADIDDSSRQLTRAEIRKSVLAAWEYVNLPSFVAHQELQFAARTDAELRQLMQSFELDFEEQFLKTVKSVFPHWKSLKSLQAAHDLVQFVMRGMAISLHQLPDNEQRVERVVELVIDELARIYEVEGLD